MVPKQKNIRKLYGKYRTCPVCGYRWKVGWRDGQRLKGLGLKWTDRLELSKTGVYVMFKEILWVDENNGIYTRLILPCGDVVWVNETCTGTIQFRTARPRWVGLLLGEYGARFVPLKEDDDDI